MTSLRCNAERSATAWIVDTCFFRICVSEVGFLSAEAIGDFSKVIFSHHSTHHLKIASFFAQEIIVTSKKLPEMAPYPITFRSHAPSLRRCLALIFSPLMPSPHILSPFVNTYCIYDKVTNIFSLINQHLRGFTSQAPYPITFRYSKPHILSPSAPYPITSNRLSPHILSPFAPYPITLPPVTS